jgi:hypothetical protein
MSGDDSMARLRLAKRILMQKLGTGQPPVTLGDIAQLRFLAETDEEREMPVEKLAAAVIQRETKTKGKGLSPEDPERRRN